MEGVPAWTTSRPKHWTEKVCIPEDKVEEVIKQLYQSKKKNIMNSIGTKGRKQRKRRKNEAENVPEAQSKENQPSQPTVTVKAKVGTTNSDQKPKNPLILPQNQILPVSVQNAPLQQATVSHQLPNLIQGNAVAQPGTFILTSHGNLVPVLTPSASVLTPVIINRPPPLLVFQTPPQPRSLPVIISRPPPNKKRIGRESTVMTFANKRPISALSKHSHPRRGGKCVAHKTAGCDADGNELLPVLTSGPPAVSPTAEFLNSFPVVATPKIVGSEEGKIAPAETKKVEEMSTQGSVSSCPETKTLVSTDQNDGTKSEIAVNSDGVNNLSAVEVSESNNSTSSLTVQLKNITSNSQHAQSSNYSTERKTPEAESSPKTTPLLPLNDDNLEKMKEVETASENSQVIFDFKLVPPSKTTESIPSLDNVSSVKPSSSSSSFVKNPELMEETSSFPNQHEPEPTSGQVTSHRCDTSTQIVTENSSDQKPPVEVCEVSQKTDVRTSVEIQNAIVTSHVASAAPLPSKITSEISEKFTAVLEKADTSYGTGHSSTASSTANINVKVSQTVAVSTHLEPKLSSANSTKTQNEPALVSSATSQLEKPLNKKELSVGNAKNVPCSCSNETFLVPSNAIAVAAKNDSLVPISSAGINIPVPSSTSVEAKSWEMKPPSRVVLKKTASQEGNSTVSMSAPFGPSINDLYAPTSAPPWSLSPSPMNFASSWGSVPIIPNSNIPSSSLPVPVVSSMPSSTRFSAPMPVISNVSTSSYSLPGLPTSILSPKVSSSVVSGPCVSIGMPPGIPSSTYLEPKVNISSTTLTSIPSVSSSSILCSTLPVTSSISSSNFPNSTLSASVLSTIPPSDLPGSTFTNLMPPVASSQTGGLHSSQNSWLPLPPIYSNEKFPKVAPTTTWRPIPADPVWTSASQPSAEPWKVRSAQSQLKIANTYGTTADVGLSSNKPTVSSNSSSHTAPSFYLQPSAAGTGGTVPVSIDRAPRCETTWSSGISRLPAGEVIYSSNVPGHTTSSKLVSSQSKYIPLSNEQISCSFNSNYKAPLEPVQALMNQNQPWGVTQHIQPFQSGLTEKLPSDNCYQSSIGKSSAPICSTNFTKPANASSLSIVSSIASNRPSYSVNNVKSNFEDSSGVPKSNIPRVSSAASISSSQAPQHMASLKVGAPVVSASSGNYSIPNTGICNPFGMNAYPPPLLKTSMTDNSYSSNFVNTFVNDVPYSSKPSFALEVSKALFSDPPYSLTVPKAPVCESTFFSNVPIYQSTTSNMLPAQTTYPSALSVSKALLRDSVTFLSSVADSAPERNRVKVSEMGPSQKESSSHLLPVSTSSTKSHPGVFSEQKVHGAPLAYNTPCTTVPSTSLVTSRSNSKSHNQVVSDSSASLWNAPYFTQAGNIPTDAGVSWGQLDYPCANETKDNRPKPPINWMTEPDQRTDGLCHVEDPFQPRYQNVFDRKDTQGPHSMMDFCFNATADEDAARAKTRKKDSEPAQDYFGWVSMKVDALVVPCTLPTLVGDLALGSDPVPTKRSKTNPLLPESYAHSRSGKSEVGGHTPQEPFTNLSKNIFDITQGETSRPTNLPETIVLKNIFELPAVPSGKQRTSHGQNSFLSVSQLVEPHNLEPGPHKSDYTYYSQRSGKGKRGSGWKCGEKKCQQSGKSCSSYSAEALLRSNDSVPVEHDYPLPVPPGCQLEFQHDPALMEAAEIPSINQQGKQKTYSSRSRKQDYWKGPDCKNSSPSNIFLPSSNFVSSKMTSDLPFSFPNLPDGRLSTPQPSNLHLPPATSSALPYPRFPCNPPAPLLPGPSFPQTKQDPTGIFPPSPGRICGPDSGYLARYPGPRKPYSYSRTGSKSAYPYPPETNRKSVGKSPANIHPPLNSSIAVGVPYSKSSLQPAPNSGIGSPLSGPFISKSSVNSVIGAPLSTAGSYPSKSAVNIQQPSHPAVGSPLSMSASYPSKSSVNVQLPPNPVLGSPLSIRTPYSSKPTGKANQPPNPLVGSSQSIGTYISKSSGVGEQSLTPVLSSPLPMAGAYPPFPSLPPHTPGSSGSSLANFNLTTIFPEMNKKGYQYT